MNAYLIQIDAAVTDDEGRRVTDPQAKGRAGAASQWIDFEIVT